MDAPGFSLTEPTAGLANLALGQRRLRSWEAALADETLLWQLLAPPGRDRLPQPPALTRKASAHAAGARVMLTLAHGPAGRAGTHHLSRAEARAGAAQWRGPEPPESLGLRCVRPYHRVQCDEGSIALAAAQPPDGPSLTASQSPCPASNRAATWPSAWVGWPADRIGF